MKKYSLALLAAVIPTTTQAITSEIPAGTIVNGGDIPSILTQKVYGEANNFTVSGGQQIMNGGVTHNSNIFPYGQQDVLKGGISYGTYVQSYGVQNIDGKSYNSTVTTRGTIDVNAGGYAEKTTVSGGSYYVSAGATSVDTVVNSGNHYISGTDKNSVLNNGTQTVRNGGVANNATVNNGTQQIETGGKSNGTIIKGGSVKVFGQADNNKVYGGRFNILSDGYAKNTTIDGGTMEVNNSGSSENTTILSGQQRVYGTERGSLVKGGTQSIRSDGSVINATISSSGLQQIGSSAVAEGTKITKGGTQQLIGNTALAKNTYITDGGLQQIDNGTADRSTITNGGKQIINGGTATNSKVSAKGIQQINIGTTAQNSRIENSGIQIVSGGTAEKTILTSGGIQQIKNNGYATSTDIYNYGIQEIKEGGIAEIASVYGQGIQKVTNGGKATNTKVYNNGLLSVENGGLAQNPVIYEKGAAWIYNGGRAENTVVDNGGWITLNKGGALDGQTVINNGSLTLIGSNFIPDLTLNNSAVFIAPSPQFSHVEFNTLNGSGYFLISSNIAKNLSDNIVINNGNGNFGLIVHDYSNATKFPDQFSVIDEKSGAKDSFYLVGGAVNVGAFKYNLEEQNGDWYLVRTQELNDSSYVAKNSFLSLASVTQTHLNSLNRQLQAQRNQNRHDNGLWVRTFGLKTKDKFKDGTLTRNDIFGTQIGYNRNIIRYKKATIDAGIFGGYSFNRQKYSLAGKGSGYTNSFGLYSTYENENHYFADIAGNYFWHNQKTTDYTPDGTDVIGKYDTDGWQANIILGKRFNVADNWFVEPQIGIDYLQINGISYQTNFNTPVNTSDFDRLSANIGLYAGKNIILNDSIKGEIYGRFKMYSHNDAKAWVQFSDHTFEEKMSSSGYEFGGGLNLSVKDNWSGYIDAGTYFGGKSTVPLELNFGFQYAF